MASVRRKAAAKGAERPKQSLGEEKTNPKGDTSGYMVGSNEAQKAGGDAYNNRPNEREGFSDRYGERGSNKPQPPAAEGGDNERSNSRGTAPPNDDGAPAKMPAAPGFKPNPLPRDGANSIANDASNPDNQPEAKPPYAGEDIRGGRGDTSWANARAKAKARMKR